MFVLTILEKIKETRLKFPQGSVIVLYGKLSKRKRERERERGKQIKICSKNKKEAILRLNMKNVQVKEFPHKLYVTTRQTCNVIAKNTPTDIRLSSDQILKFSQGIVTVLWIMVSYQETRVELTNTELNKLKSTAKNNQKTRTILRLNFEDEELPHELFLTTRRTTKIRNVFSNNMLTDTKFNKAQASKIIQSGGSFGSWSGNLGKKAYKHWYSFSKRQFTLISKQFNFKCNK